MILRDEFENLESVQKLGADGQVASSAGWGGNEKTRRRRWKRNCDALTGEVWMVGEERV
jgi:hypothetical protein